jgi:ABC-2 type transport system ATP-binding protein
MQEIILTQNLTKYFGMTHAVEGIDIRVKRGEIYGFLGLNGAGKTTAIRMLLGLINPTSGTAFLKGQRVHPGNTAMWNEVGYLVEIPYAYPDLTVRENLEIIRRLRFIKDSGVVDKVMEQLQLTPYKGRKARHLSLGNSQRLGLAKAIMHQPEILILDEPANGLDPAGIVEIRELLHHLAFDRGVTVLISSHILGEISRFATRIGIIHEGRMVQESNASELVSLRHRTLRIGLADPAYAMILLGNAGYSGLTPGEGTIEVTDRQATRHPEIVNAMLVKEGIPPWLLKVEEEDLESYFLRVIGVNGGKS